MKTILAVLILLASPLVAEQTCDDRYEIFTVKPRTSTDDEKYSVLLDKRTGRMWDLDKSFFALPGEDNRTFHEILWKPSRKFDDERAASLWAEQYGKAFRKANEK